MRILFSIKSVLLLAFFLSGQAVFSQVKVIIVTGNVYDKETKKPLAGIAVKVQNSTIVTETNKKGQFELMVPKLKHLTLLVSSISYKKEIRELDLEDYKDTARVYFYLKQETYTLDSVDIFSKTKPDTVFGTNKFSVIDFDFHEDKYILLTVDRKTDKPFVRLADEGQHILSSFPVPKEAGEIKELFHDFLGYTNVICKEAIYKVRVKGDKISLASLPVEDYNSMIRPVIDTINNQLLFSNYSRDFPMFSYMSYNIRDSSRKTLAEVEDADLMHAYRFEYYSLKPADRLLARNLADDYGMDKHQVAALLTGFTHSMFYTPLYAPLYVIGDTIHVFDHYKDCLFHLDKAGKKIDSVKIGYHHPKNWRDWKNVMLKDMIDNSIYAVYDSNGHKYMKRINYRNGKEEGKYKIIHHSAEKIKIRDGYIYYVYRPFESGQEKFLYMERVVLDVK